MSPETKNKVKVVLTRLARAFAAGAVGAIVPVTLFSGVSTWTDLQTALSAGTVVVIVGGITGVLMAADKLLRWEPAEAPTL